MADSPSTLALALDVAETDGDWVAAAVSETEALPELALVLEGVIGVEPVDEPVRLDAPVEVGEAEPVLVAVCDSVAWADAVEVGEPGALPEPVADAVLGMLAVCELEP